MRGMTEHPAKAPNAPREQHAQSAVYSADTRDWAGHRGVIVVETFLLGLGLWQANSIKNS